MLFAPGLIFAGDESVAPDVVWISRGKLSLARGLDSTLHAALTSSSKAPNWLLLPGTAAVQRARTEESIGTSIDLAELRAQALHLHMAAFLERVLAEATLEG